MQMLDRLSGVEARFCEIEQALHSADLYDDPKRAAALLREQKDLTPVVEAFRAYRSAEEDLVAARELMRDADPDMRAMGEEEEQAAKQKMDEL